MRSRRRVLAVLAATTAAVGLTLVAAPSASADEIWYQAVGRSSGTSACPTNSAEDTAAGWTEWTGSWEQWANAGRGGYVCERSNVWAHTSGGGSGGTPIGCQEFVAGLMYFNVGSEPVVPKGSNRYQSPVCEGFVDGSNSYPLVYAPGGPSQATDLCNLYTTIWGGTLEHYGSAPLYGCQGAT